MRFRFYKASRVLVFKTDIENHEKLKQIKPVFDHQHSILEWSVDVQDIDKVLRIETKGSMTERKIINLMAKVGVACIVMTW
jgi:hypothetical protein